MKKIIKENKFLYLYFLLIVLVLSTLYTPIYAKFSNDYSTEDDVVGISFDFNLKISDIEEYKSMSVDAFDAMIFNIKVTNYADNTIYYGIWYRMIEPDEKNDSIVIAREESSKEGTTGSVDASHDKTVTIVVKNKTDKKIRFDFGVSSSDKDANSIEYLGGKRLISGVDKIVYLNEVLTGSYVSYTGNGGCVGNNCSGENANYVNKDNMGYCGDSKHKMLKNGWQLAYTKDSSAFIVSAGSVECVATNEAGSISVGNNQLSSFEKTLGTPKHLTNLNNEALKYCNEEFSYDSVCNGNTVWAFNEKDLNAINNMPIKACYKNHSESCEGVNDIVIGSGDYWLATNFDKTTTNYYWDGVRNYLSDSNTNINFGLRPVIKLDANVYVVDGDGSIDNPYKIANELIKEE